MLRILMRLYRRIVAAPARSQRYRPERHYMRGAGPASLRKLRDLKSGDVKSGDGRVPVRAEAARRKQPADHEV